MPTVTISANTGADFSGASETELFSGSPTTNYSSTNFPGITKYAAGDHRHTMFRYDCSGISGPVTVSDATLSINIAAISGAHVASLRRILQALVMTQATWNIYATSSNWATAGGLSDGTDRVATASGATASFSTTGVKTFTGAGMLTDVEGWINGSLSNYGWHGERTDAANDFRYNTLTASEGADTQRPSLSITYAAAASARAPRPRYLNQAVKRAAFH